MPKGRKAVKTKKKVARKVTRGRLWTGTGLCCEAQGDGVPCRGVDGECESCGRALPLSDART
jgi:hypothetical protein